MCTVISFGVGFTIALERPHLHAFALPSFCTYGYLLDLSLCYLLSRDFFTTGQLDGNFFFKCGIRAVAPTPADASNQTRKAWMPTVR
jgi:hypothetical protein